MAPDAVEERERLPVFPSAARSRPAPEAWRLHLDGLVHRRLEWTLADLRRFPRVCATRDFVCHEGWVVRALAWEGIPLQALVEDAGPLADARYVVVASGDFTTCCPLDALADVLLADTLDGLPLAAEHGGPLRLVGPADGDCFASIKWVDRITLTASEVESTGRRMALGRLAPTQERGTRTEVGARRDP